MGKSQGNGQSSASRGLRVGWDSWGGDSEPPPHQAS